MFSRVKNATNKWKEVQANELADLNNLANKLAEGIIDTVDIDDRLPEKQQIQKQEH